MADAEDDFSADLQVMCQEQVVGLVYAAFQAVFYGNDPELRFLFVHAFEDFGEVSAWFNVHGCSEEGVDCALAESASFSLEGYSHFLFPCFLFLIRHLFMPFIIASTLAMTMSSLAARADTICPFSSSTFITTSATAFEPPVMASRRYSFSLIFARLLVSFCMAFKTASTGPTPVSAAMYSFPSKTRRTDAVGITLIPVTTARSHRSTIFSSGITSPITAEVNASRSASVTILPLSHK